MLVSPQSLRVGDSATLAISVTGTGDIGHALEPPTQNLDTFKIYDDKPVVQWNDKGEALSGTKIFKKAIVPLHSGDQVLGPTTLTYFDPQERSFKTIASQPITLHVAASDRPAPAAATAIPLVPLVPQKVDVKILGDDILPLYKRDDALLKPHPTPKLAWATWLAFPPLCCLLHLWWQRRRTLDPKLRRRSTALRRAQQNAAQLTEASQSTAARDTPAQASRILREFIGDKLRREGVSLTPLEVGVLLRQHGVEAHLTDDVQAWLARCEAAQYGADPAPKTPA